MLIGTVCLLFLVAVCIFVPNGNGFVSKPIFADSKYKAKTIIIDAGHGELTNTID